MLPNEFAVEVINDFIQTWPEFYHPMVNTNHFSQEYGYFNNYHVGESVWTHTMMVMSHTLAKLERCDYIDQEEYKEIILAVLLHDIGKPGAFALDHDRKKITFHGHEQLSTVLAVDVLVTLVKKRTITQEQMITVLYLINQHTLFYDLNPDRLEGKTFRKLMSKIDPHHVRQLLFLRVVDMLGNNSTKQEVRPEAFDSDDLAYKLVSHAVLELDNAYDDTLPVVKLMIGLPGSGKSHFLKDAEETILSRDAIVEELAPDGVTYSEAFQMVDQSYVDQLFEQRLNALVQKRESFIVDKTNLTRKARRKITNRLKGKYNVRNIVMLTTFETIQDRNIDREVTGKRIPDNVIDRFSKMYTLPMADEEFVVFVSGDE